MFRLGRLGKEQLKFDKVCMALYEVLQARVTLLARVVVVFCTGVVDNVRAGKITAPHVG